MKNFRNILNWVLICFLITQVGNIWAIPADPTPFKLQQPDGKEFHAKLHGDEFLHFITTTDGYTIIKSPDGFYKYAVQNHDENILPGKYTAKDPAERSNDEVLFLNSVKRYLHSRQSKPKLSHSLANSLIRENSLKRISSTQFKGIIILAQFTDRSFLPNNSRELFDATINQPNYREDDFTGSVRDYFYDTSRGIFEPQFHIVGPVTLDYKQTDALGSDNGQALVRDACIKADQFVDFSNYDLNDDGEVDMIYVIFAGGGSHAGNNADFIWPHAYALNYSRVKLDGVYCNRYACSTELAGRENNKIRDGIGTICHEFSHVLGLPDFYDTDYEENGSAPHPGDWSLMASGGYLNNGRTPCSYSAFERYAIGWASPELIKESGNYTLPPLTTSNESFRINSAVPKEFFILENRIQEGWDKYLPGKGMLVFRVDSTNPNVWIQNTINNNPNHVYYELIRANNSLADGGGNTFPGTTQRESLTDDTTPSLRSWTGTPTETSLLNIKEENNIISFTVNKTSYNRLVETFESISKPNWNQENVSGILGSWNFSNAITYATTETNMGNGLRVASIKRGKIEMEFNTLEDIKSVSLIAGKKTATSPPQTIKIEISKDNGSNWVTYGSTITLTENKMNTYIIDEEITAPVRFRIVNIGTSEALVDDFTITEKRTSTTITRQQEDSIKFYTSERNLYVQSDKDKQLVEIFSIEGRQILSILCDKGWNEIPIKSPGIYIIKIDNHISKLICN